MISLQDRNQIVLRSLSETNDGNSLNRIANTLQDIKDGKLKGALYTILIPYTYTTYYTVFV